LKKQERSELLPTWSQNSIITHDVQLLALSVPLKDAKKEIYGEKWF